MFGYSISSVIIALFAFIIIVFVEVWIGRKLCRLKGFNLNWAWFAILSPGITYLALGIPKAKVDCQSDKEIMWSKIAILTGIILALIQLETIVRNLMYNNSIVR